MEWALTAWSGLLLHGVGSYCMVWALTAWCGLLLHGVGSYCMVWALTAWCGLLLHGVGSYCMVWALTAWCGLLLHGVGSYCMVWALTAWSGLLLHGVGSYYMYTVLILSLMLGLVFHGQWVWGGWLPDCVPDVCPCRWNLAGTPLQKLLSPDVFANYVIMVSRIRNTSCCYVPVWSSQGLNSLISYILSTLASYHTRPKKMSLFTATTTTHPLYHFWFVSYVSVSSELNV